MADSPWLIAQGHGDTDEEWCVGSASLVLDIW